MVLSTSGKRRSPTLCRSLGRQKSPPGRRWDQCWRLKIKVGAWAKPQLLGGDYSCPKISRLMMMYHDLPWPIDWYMSSHIIFCKSTRYPPVFGQTHHCSSFWADDRHDRGGGSPLAALAPAWKVGVDTLLVGVLKQGGGVAEKASWGGMDQGCWWCLWCLVGWKG